MKAIASDRWAATETKALDERQRLSAREMRMIDDDDRCYLVGWTEADA